jgi:hypothetical protein
MRAKGRLSVKIVGRLLRGIMIKRGMRKFMLGDNGIGPSQNSVHFSEFKIEPSAVFDFNS